MRIDKTGKISENLYMIGAPFSPAYLVDGKYPALFDGGFTFMGKRYLAEIKQYLGGRDLSYIFLTHSHFDHCGTVSFLKENFPSAKIVSSVKAKQVLAKPNAIDSITTLNMNVGKMVGNRKQEILGDENFDLLTRPFESFSVDITAKEGDLFMISDNLTVCVYETPGHTNDSLSYHIKEKNALMAGDALGTMDQSGYIFSDWLVDYDLYYGSLEKMRSLNPDIICLGHIYAFTGEDAKSYIPDSISHARKFLKLIETSLAEHNGELQEVIAHIKSLEYDGKDGLAQPEPAYLLNLTARIRSVQRRMET